MSNFVNLNDIENKDYHLSSRNKKLIEDKNIMIDTNALNMYSKLYKKTYIRHNDSTERSARKRYELRQKLEKRRFNESYNSNYF